MVDVGSDGVAQTMANMHWSPAKAPYFAQSAVLLHFARGYGCMSKGTPVCKYRKTIKDPEGCVSKYTKRYKRRRRVCRKSGDGNSSDVVDSGPGGALSRPVRLLEERLAAILECAGARRADAADGGNAGHQIPASCLLDTALPSLADEWSAAEDW